MVKIIPNIAKSARRFLRQDRGSIAAETVMVVPALILGYLAFFAYWDIYRMSNVIQKATYTVSDMVSRELAALPTTYIPGMKSLLEYMINDQTDVKLRVTSVVFSEGVNILDEDDPDDSFSVQWSISPEGGMTPWTNETLTTVVDRIPRMSDGDSVVLVETELTVQPVFEVGLSNQVISNFVVTRPRFLPKICLVGSPC